MRNKTLLMSLIFVLTLLCGINHAQVYKFQHYGMDKGICHLFIYSIAQDKQGFIWLATGTGLCRYDGVNFTTPNANLPTVNATCSFMDNMKNLWFGYSDGHVVKYDGLNFTVADTSKATTTINQIIQAPQGELLIATQTEGITRINDSGVQYLNSGPEKKLIYSICFIDENQLMVGCQDGLYVYNYQSKSNFLRIVAKVDSIPDAIVRAIIPRANGGFWVATEDAGLYSIEFSDEDVMISRLNIPELENTRIQSLTAHGQDLWVSTFGSGALLQIKFNEDGSVIHAYNYNKNNKLGSDYIKQIFFDNQENLWVGTFGHGIARLPNLAMSFIESLPSINNNATAICFNGHSEYWIAGNGAIILITDKSVTQFDHSHGLPNDKITALYSDKEYLWIGTESSGLYALDKNKGKISLKFHSGNSLANTIQAITYLNDKLWLATRNGVVIINLLTGIVEHLGTTDGLPHNNIHDIFKDSKGTIWIATTSNSIVAVNKEKRLTTPDGVETEFSCITEDSNGNIWAGTLGRGVYMFDQKNDTTYHFTTQNGLKTDFCYAIKFDNKEHVWVGHRLGISRIKTTNYALTSFGIDNGITGDVNPNAMATNKGEELLVGFTDGVMIYNLLAEKSRQYAPILNLTSVTIGDVQYSPFEPLSLSFERYRVRFDFMGLQYTNPEDVTYQYILQGYDHEWSEPSPIGTVTYPRLEDGDYKFWVRACNKEQCTEETMLFILKIRKPYWKTWWFICLIITAVISSVYGIVVIRDRNHRKQQEYLEKELDARTKEVLMQKEEIELKNRDITDSINYAQRIQFSILPSTSTLMNHCSDAFIFYRPRDIVSGDFYWFDYIERSERLVVVCADSTGHGVPGAFMSLIGTTIIKDISHRDDVQNPIDLLYRLDENIQSTLNQNQESEHANDGMDIAVCEINTRTLYVKIASAMRPFIVVKDGKQTVYKGSRASIGGQSGSKKEFEMEEMQLSKGDIIYLFSDGYSDQFGGPAGKKLKMVRLQNIINDIHHRRMDEQHRFIKENFDLWKGNLEQIDDVLIIGIRL